MFWKIPNLRLTSTLTSISKGKGCTHCSKGREMHHGDEHCFPETSCGIFYEWSWHVSICVQSLQSCLILCDPMDCSPSGSSVHGIFQARILECVAMPSSRGSAKPRDWTSIYCISWIEADSLSLSHREAQSWWLNWRVFCVGPVCQVWWRTCQQPSEPFPEKHRWGE